MNSWRCVTASCTCTLFLSGVFFFLGVSASALKTRPTTIKREHDSKKAPLVWHVSSINSSQRKLLGVVLLFSHLPLFCLIFIKSFRFNPCSGAPLGHRGAVIQASETWRRGGCSQQCCVCVQRTHPDVMVCKSAFVSCQ